MVPDPPPLETHFLELLREAGGFGGGLGGQKMTPPLFWVENHESLGVFSILSQKGVSGSRLHGVCMERNETSVDAIYALISHFCYVGDFGDLVTPCYPL